MAYVRKRGDRFYAVVYQGLDPVTGKELRNGTPPEPTERTPNGSPSSSPPSKPRTRPSVR